MPDKVEINLFKVAAFSSIIKAVAMRVSPRYVYIETRLLDPRRSQSAEIKGKIIICPGPPQGRRNKNA